MKQNYKLKSLFFAALALLGKESSAQTTFNYTGAVQTYTVPAGVTSIQVEAWGAQGGDNFSSTGGLGGYISGDLTVTPGQVLDIYVGGQNGYNGGGAGGSGSGSIGYNGMNGGGASDVRTSGGGLADRLVVAGGGGGAGRGDCVSQHGGAGGYPGGTGGQAGNPAYAGADGTAMNGGNSGAGDCGGSCSCSPGGGGGGGGNGGGAGGGYGPSFGGLVAIGGSGGACGQNGDPAGGGAGSEGQGGCFGQGGAGGTSSNGGGAGGGGGWYGGGAGGGNWATGGGGGSSYVVPAATSLAFTNGTNSGNGQVVITVLCSSLTTTVSSTTLCIGESFIVTATSGNGGTISWDNGVMDGVAFTPAVAGTVTYTATSTDPSDCAFSVDIEVFDLPTVTAGVDNTEICLGESVIFTGSGTADSYVWDNGVTNAVAFTPAAAGAVTYSVTGTNTTTSCENTSTVDVTVYDLINIAVTATDEMLGSDGAINITVTGGNPAYTFDWDLDGTGDFDDTEDLTSLDPGTYIVVVEDASSCASATETIVIGSQLGVSENNTALVRVYPNPTTELVTIEFAGIFTYTLTSVNGDIIYSGTATDKGTISLSELASGNYLVIVNGTETIQVVKN